MIVDAVETYNDTWEHQYRLQEDRLEHPEAETHVKDESVRQIDSKRKVFMGEVSHLQDTSILYNILGNKYILNLFVCRGNNNAKRSCYCVVKEPRWQQRRYLWHTIIVCKG